MSWGECRACGEDLVNGEGTCDECLLRVRAELDKLPVRLRALAEHLSARPYAASLDGYGLVDGLRAAADLLEGRSGPEVHSDCLPGSDLFHPKVTLSEVRATGQSSEDR